MPTKLGTFSCTMLGIALLTVGSGHSAGQTSTRECDKVELRAEVVFPKVHPHLLAVGVYGLGKTKYCRFSIHLSPTLFPDQRFSQPTQNGLQLLEYLFRIYNNMDPISIEGYADLNFTTASRALVDDLEYLLASADPEADIPPDRLQIILEENTDLLTSCFADFYQGKDPSGKAEGLECRRHEDEENTLNINVEYDTAIYSLYTFR